ncbi:sensor histidine kinase [Mesorhizobium sp. M8A.F.Ca.ET.208.01.1.1]|uniref:sensor histidine kinase n=1 Tax=unclassified Mesorhizobium TaxID=325217 RepID=UPI000FD1DCDC|nr:MULTISPECIES: ATP-binding protein [unclassified Mesorhizobium]RUX04163.1 sensor histidine kinase [Mesorhizobium sp. M8A.F.Ca.ET.023.01.1.1]RWC72082.1 MAG: sensor histidine kinase [Mesorhizobium sp.]TGQ87106.1 sensor histidine kinase [Mesorhizobium sp. M8A.F.Ca.ET.208.01.1.1]TGT49216.1 sensor histidine kinase [Mesorhizobium sp. M8A.F.Ca.ET.167.01.1.1]
MSPKPLKFKPYARLLTMLGDQLIRNEQVALSELIKNAYDADATWVKVTFEGFDGSFRAGTDAKIVVEDDGQGMSSDVIENHWANPATPLKLMDKNANRRTTPSGRIVQGEKGIGRFALLKLGRDVKMTTRPTGSPDENVLELKLADFNENFIQGNRAMFLDELELELETVSPAKTIVQEDVDLGGRMTPRRPQGTRIEISPPVGRWTRAKVTKVYEELTRLQSIFPGEQNSEPSGHENFAVYVYRDKTYEPLGTDKRERLEVLMSDNAVFRIVGRYDENDRAFHFDIDGQLQDLKLVDPEVSGLAVFRDYLKGLDLKPDQVDQLRTECGSFGFSFFVFDFSNDAKGKHQLNKDDKELIKNHRIYLYRDDIRVYPYGDPDDDWLLIDVRRGTVRASEFLSNDQVVGFVKISQEGNPDLRDKTSREGLVDTGRAVEDFRSLLQTFLAWVRKTPYNQYKQRSQKSQDVDVFRSGKVQSLMDDAITAAAAEHVPPVVREKLSEANRQYKAERRYLVQRAENTEHLAGVGLSVEAASHDLMIAMQRVMAAIDRLIVQCDSDAKIDKEALRAELLAMRGLLSFIQSQMADMQMLFRSTKQRRKDIRVSELVEKVAKIFRSLLERHSIQVTVESTGSPLVAKTTDAVLLQLLLNLFDNSTYWLQSAPQPREIEILLDGDAGRMIFADSGPGFREEDLPYLFEPFYSGKGEEGRGLGLYIARQLLERHEYSIDIAGSDQRILKGANLVVSFVKGQA